jgi:hypothetical protein
LLKKTLGQSLAAAHNRGQLPHDSAGKILLDNALILLFAFIIMSHWTIPIKTNAHPASRKTKAVLGPIFLRNKKNFLKDRN